MGFYHEGRGQRHLSMRESNWPCGEFWRVRNFVFRMEREPAQCQGRCSYRISDLELASRLSFFLWSSIPDDELLETGKPGKTEGSGRAGGAGPAHAARQPARVNWSAILPVSGSICETCRASRRTLEEFPGFDDNLRQAFRQETELFFESIFAKIAA